MIIKRVGVKMQQKKQIELMSKKMNATEILLDLVPIIYYGSSGIKYQQKLGITSEMFYFIHNNHIKKQISINNINMVTVSAYSQEIVLHCEDDDVRLCSFQNAKIFKNILKVREMVLNKDQKFTVLLEKQKHLGKYAGQDDKKKGFFSTLFGRHNNQKHKNGSGSSHRNSYCKLEVQDKYFLHQISKNIYACRCEQTELLYISGGHCFFFDDEQHKKEEIDRRTVIFQNRYNKDNFIMRKIRKQNKASTAVLRQYLKNYRLKNNQEEILYATESKLFFQIISPYSKDQFNLQTAIEQQKKLSQIDLVSIFYKLMGLIDGQTNVFCSLRPKYIIVKENIVILSVSCINSSQINLNYLAPEELDPTIAIEVDPELINFWKIAMLLYQTAFLKQPFPVQHLAQLVVHNKPLKLYFPPSHRSTEFKHFLVDILQIDPGRRGGGNTWKKKIFEHKWIKQTMR